MSRIFLFFTICLFLTSCNEGPEQEKEEQLVRGLKTIVIKEVEQTVLRRYPSVLQPGSISTVSFEVAGRLQEINLDVGQDVKKDEVLAEIDTRSLEIQVQSARSALAEAKSVARNAAEDAQRKADLLKKGIISEAGANESKTNAETSAARVVQAQRSVETAEENFAKAKLLAPFDGIINSVEVQSFANVTAGAAIATIYAVEAFETSFSVSFDVVNKLAVGKKVKIRLADNPDIVLSGHVSELGAKADTVSSFPVVVKLDEIEPSIKAGMAVEISMEFTVPSGEGFTLPLSVLPFDGNIEASQDPNQPTKAQVYIFDPSTSTVGLRDILIAGVRDNAIIVIDGLVLGEHVASAGVSFLRDGQKVKLITDQN